MLLAADYSQIDLRVLAHISEDPGLIKAFHDGADIHASTAPRTCYGVPMDEVTAEMRRIAKTINFGIIYGISGFGLANRTGLSNEEAQTFINQYFERYPGVKEYMEVTKHKAKAQGYVQTVLGRRRHFPEFNSRNHNLRMAAERMAINMPIQGTSAEITKLAMIGVQNRMDEAHMQSRMLLQVHDELIFEAPKERGGGDVGAGEGGDGVGAGTERSAEGGREDGSQLGRHGVGDAGTAGCRGDAPGGSARGEGSDGFGGDAELEQRGEGSFSGGIPRRVDGGDDRGRREAGQVFSVSA